MKRFFLEQELKAGSTLELSREESKHALRVLRLVSGDEVLVTNGKGIEAKARLLVSSAKENAALEIFEVRILADVQRPRIELLQGILKGPKMDWLVEKATEIGVQLITPITTQYSVALEGKEDRWKRIVQASMKQSGNAMALEINKLQSLESVLGKKEAGAFWKFVLCPDAHLSLLQQVQIGLKAGPLPSKARIVLAIGPEGGFSKKEEEAFIEAGFMPASLSKNILRGETAAIAAAAILAHTIDFT